MKRNTMRSFSFIIAVTTQLFCCVGNSFGSGTKDKLPQLSESNIKKVIGAMTLEEKAYLVVGAGIKSGLKGEMAKRNPFEPEEGTLAYATENYPVPGIGRTLSIPRLGVPSIVMADGPAGVSLNLTRFGDTTKYYSTAFPIATSLASSWNDGLVYKVGECMGNETSEYGVDIVLTPAVNIQRNPLCGRNFEYFSEDPLVSGKMGAAMVRGIESQGVGSSLKHYVANNQETNRTSVDAEISERALREIYLRGFNIVVKEANPWTVMASYNSVNGNPMTQNKDLVTNVLKQEWNYKGLVMTDWGAGTDPVAQMEAGVDLIMPGSKEAKKIIQAVQEGRLREAILDVRVEQVLKLVLKSHKYKQYQSSNKPDLTHSVQIAREAAAEGMVLLKNENSALPIADKAQSVALFGNGTYITIAGGAGSGFVMNAPATTNFVDGLLNFGFNDNKQLSDIYRNYLTNNTPRTKFLEGIRGRIQRAPEMQVDRVLAKEVATEADYAIVTITRNSEEGKDREVEYDFNLSETERNNLKNISEAFRKKGKKVVVVLNIGSVIETASWRDLADAILIAWQPGQVAGDALADVISGTANPSGKLSMSFPLKYQDVPSAKSFPGTPEEDPKTAVYEEGIYVGYRYYNSFGVTTAYPFGYGLSYTKFEYSDIKLSSTSFKNDISVSVLVTNIGNVPGKEVVQLYLSAAKGDLNKPAQELRAYDKTNVLKPGESQLLKFAINPMDLASFNADKNAWVADAGEYQVKIGASSEDIKLTASFSLASTLFVEKVATDLNPKLDIAEFKKP